MKRSFLLTASAAALMIPGVSHAQNTTDAGTTDPTAAATSAEPQDASSGDDIVVTAERRTVSLQRSGVAASVLTGEDLVKKSIQTVEQLQFATPSLTVNNQGQGNAFNIRGIGKTDGGSATGVGVITYRDGVATLPGYFQGEPYYDIASVEVLRGPQGTFAGQNATGGAVFVTSANPNFNGVGGYFSGQYGNYNNVRLQGAINLPVSDTLALRVAGNVENRDSFYNITPTNGFSGDPGQLRSRSARASLLWQPTSQLRILLKGDYNYIGNGGYPGSPATATNDPFDITSNAVNYGHDESARVVLNIAYTFDSGIVLRSISGYQKGSTVESLDSDGTGTGNNVFTDDVDERIWSQEVNLVSADTGRFTWVLGGYYQDDKLTFPPGGYYSGTPAGGFDLRLEGINPKTAVAAFAQAGYEITNGLQIQIGGRWSRSTSRNVAVYRIPQYALVLPQNDFTSDKKVTGKVALNWTIDASNFAYAFVATGHKAGGLNGLNLAFLPPIPFKPENVTDYEIGWKSTWFGGHLRTQLGGYYTSYKDFQVNIADPRSPTVASIYNVGDATELYGVEFSAQGSFGNFGFDVATSVSNSSLGTFYAVDPRIPALGICNQASGPATASCRNLTGNDQTYAPKFTLSAGAQYVFQLSDDLTLTPRVDYAHIASAYGTLFQNVTRGDRLGERNILNTQLTLATGKWSIGAYGTNVGDQHYIAAVNGTRRLAGPPRQYGLRVSRSF